MGVRLNIPHTDFSANGMAVSSNIPIGPAVVSIAVTGASTATNGTAYTATATLENGTTMDVTTMATWSISNAECSISNGVLSAPAIISASDVVITASYTDPNSGVITGSKTVAVTGSITQYDYIRTTENNQYIKLMDTGTDIEGIPLGEFDIEVKGYTVADLSTNYRHYLLEITGNTGVLLFRNATSGNVDAVGVEYATTESPYAAVGSDTNTEFVVRVQPALETASVKIGDNQAVTGSINSTYASSTSPVRTPMYAFSKASLVSSTANTAKIKEIILYQRGTNTKRLHFVPVKDSNNRACLYEKINNKFYYEANNGTLYVGNM